MLSSDVESGLQKEVLLDQYDRTAKAGGFRTSSRTSMNPVRGNSLEEGQPQGLRFLFFGAIIYASV